MKDAGRATAIPVEEQRREGFDVSPNESNATFPMLGRQGLGLLSLSYVTPLTSTQLFLSYSHAGPEFGLVLSWPFCLPEEIRGLPSLRGREIVFITLGAVETLGPASSLVSVDFHEGKINVTRQILTCWSPWAAL